MRIALTGSIFSGKTSLADMLEAEYGWTKLNFTDRIKIHLAKGLSAIHGRPVTVTEIAENKGKYRRLLQDLSIYLGYDQGYDVQALLDEWNALGVWPKEPVVWDCVRHETQADILRDNGFTIIELDVDLGVQQARAFRKGINAERLHEMMGHEVEEGVIPDMLLDGNRPTGELAEVLARLSGKPYYTKPAEKPLNIYVKYGEPASMVLN